MRLWMFSLGLYCFIYSGWCSLGVIYCHLLGSIRVHCPSKRWETFFNLRKEHTCFSTLMIPYSISVHWLWDDFLFFFRLFSYNTCCSHCSALGLSQWVCSDSAAPWDEEAEWQPTHGHHHKPVPSLGLSGGNRASWEPCTERVWNLTFQNT